MRHYLINDRAYTHALPLPDELRFNPDKNYLFDLSYLAGLDVLGEQAQDFLQGQLSADLRAVHLQQMQPGALCNLQGRILALMDIIQWQGLHLIMPADLLEQTQLTLAKTALFSKVRLNLTSSFAIFGFYLQNARDRLPLDVDLPNCTYEVKAHQSCCYQLTKQLFIVLVPLEQVASFKAQFPETQQRGSLAWHLLQLQAGRLEIYPTTRGVFLPHRLGLHQTAYISFDKGCYIGQEIIARTHYRATLKHQVKLFKLDPSEPLTAGQKIFDEATKAEIGELIDFCPTADGQYLIAVSALFEHSYRVIFEHHTALHILIESS